jgi:hypothetical protein
VGRADLDEASLLALREEDAERVQRQIRPLTGSRPRVGTVQPDGPRQSRDAPEGLLRRGWVGDLAVDQS